MKRRFAKPRSLALVVALALVAAMCTVSTAYAASTTAGIRAAPSNATDASDTPCTIDYQSTTCQSTNPAVTVYTYFSGDQNGCSYVDDVSWGDGESTGDVFYTDPGDGFDLLGNHNYAAAGTYTISVALEVTAGDCTSGSGFTAQFTLLAPTPPPAPSPKIHWDHTSGRPGTLVTVTGSGWAPGGIIQFQQQEKDLFLGITTWTVDSHGNWKQSFAEQDAPPGTYKVSFSETSGHLLVTGSFKVLDQPTLTERFSNWVDACYHGKLKFDPECTDALDEAAHLKISFTGVAACLVDLVDLVVDRGGNPGKGILTCIIEDGIPVATWVYNTWKSWWTHKPGP
jgi:hypothetical protein